jgi:hypothetical protein
MPKGAGSGNAFLWDTKKYEITMNVGEGFHALLLCYNSNNA